MIILTLGKDVTTYLSCGISWHISADNLTDSLEDKLTNIWSYFDVYIDLANNFYMFSRPTNTKKKKKEKTKPPSW